MGKVEKKQTRKTKSLKEKHYPCSYCSKTFSESGGRNHHMLLHSSARPFACHLCAHTCKTKKYLYKHMRVVHEPPSSLKCDYCDKMFHYQSTLNKHMLVHTNAKPYKCSECGKAFNSGYSLGVHVRIHKDQKPYQCQYCEYACRDGSTLRKHHARHLGIVERYDCEICGKRYSKKGVLQRHVAEVHLSAQLRTAPCAHCDKMFWSKGDADRHVRIVHKRQYATSCEICGMKITSKYNMGQHLLSHIEARPYKCAFAGCGKRFKDAPTLKKHTIIHCPEKQFPCKVCGRRFTRLSRLVKHKSQHLVRVKNVQCDLCGVFFYNKNYLVLHMRRKHARHRGRFVCDLCAFVCGNKPGMIMHLRGHTGDTYHKAPRRARPRRRYVCDLCDAECCSKTGIIMHIKGHSSRKDKECFICRRKYKKDLWLRLHLKQAHKVNVAQGSPAIRTDIKVEPVDMEMGGSPEFELFEVEKEELLDELAFINHDTNQDYNEDADQDRNTCEQNVTETHAAATETSHTEPSKDISNDSNLQDKESTVSSTGNSNMEQNTKTNGHEKEHSQSNEIASDNEQCHVITEHAVVEVSDGNNVYNSTDKSEEVPAENKQKINYTEDTVVKDSDNLIQIKEKSNEIPLEDVHSKRDSTKHTEVLENPGVNNVDQDLEISKGIPKENTEEKKDSNEYKEIEETPIVNNRKDIVISKKTKSESEKDKDSKVKAILNKAIEDNLISKKILIVNLDNRLNKKQSNVNHIQPSTKSINMKIDQKGEDDLTQDITEHSEYSNIKSIRSDNETRKSNYKRPVKNTVKNISGNPSTDNHNSDKQVKIVTRNNGITKTHSKNKKIIVDFNKNKNHLKNSSTNNKSSDHSKIKFHNNKTSKEASKSVSLNNDKDSTTKSSSKRKSLAQIREKILKKNRKVTRIEINSKDSPEEEIQENVGNSKVVSTEDVTRSMTKKKKNSGKHIDDFLLNNMVHQPKESNEDLVEVDEECESLARDSVELLLQESRQRREVRLVERTRLEYNDRIRRARDIRTEKVSIKYFDKSNEKLATKVETKTDVDDHSINDDENNVISEEKIKDNSQDKSNDSNIATEDTTTNNCAKEDRNTNISEEKDNTETSEDKDTCEGLDKTSNETELLLVDKEFSKPDGERDDNSNCEQKGETDRIKLRSSSGVVKKRYVDDESNDDGNKKDVSDVRKIKLNTHQCYVCFKLFDTKDTLLDHCKDHFDVCNSTILKKCPLCDFATKLSIAQHMKTKHDVKITIPSTKIVGKESETGTGYCYKVKSSTIEDIDIIPSVKHLNKQAYIDIDKKRRKLKDTGIAKTKLVKKGNEWIVERKTTKIDNVEDYILPEFDVDEILAVKIVSNDYLTRMKKLHRLAKKYKRAMLFPCEHCEKICLNMAALKLHYRRHEPGAKPFKKKVWKHKMVDKVETKRKVKRKNEPVKEIDRIEKAEERTNDNRYKKPKPVVNKHKCDPELIKFYETNIKGGDIEFWQFLKIFNKMSRENVNDFEDLAQRPEYGIHFDEPSIINSKEDVEVNNGNINRNNRNTDENNKKISVKDKGIDKNKIKNVDKNNLGKSNKFKRIIRISRKEYERRNELKQQLREKILHHNNIDVQN